MFKSLRTLVKGFSNTTLCAVKTQSVTVDRPQQAEWTDTAALPELETIQCNLNQAVHLHVSVCSGSHLETH